MKGRLRRGSETKANGGCDPGSKSIWICRLGRCVSFEDPVMSSRSGGILAIINWNSTVEDSLMHARYTLCGPYLMLRSLFVPVHHHHHALHHRRRSQSPLLPPCHPLTAAAHTDPL